jgi:hypothetical protein
MDRSRQGKPVIKAEKLSRTLDASINHRQKSQQKSKKLCKSTQVPFQKNLCIFGCAEKKAQREETGIVWKLCLAIWEFSVVERVMERPQQPHSSHPATLWFQSTVSPLLDSATFPLSQDTTVTAS